MRMMAKNNQGKDKEKYKKTNEGNAAYPEYSDREHQLDQTSVNGTKSANYPE